MARELDNHSPAGVQTLDCRMKIKLIALTLFVGLVALGLAGCQATRAGYQTAPYCVVRADGRFEVRDYPALTVVETPSAVGGTGDDGSFMRLFHYIGGKNASKQKIAMTTPVLMSGDATHRTMAFVMPADLASADAPGPSEDAVKIRTLAAGRFAVLRYKGGHGPKSEAEALSRLKAWVAAQGLNTRSTPVYGYFDPPWTPGFLRRNEVMLRIE